MSEENKDTTKDQKPAESTATAAAPDENLISLDDMDKLIQEQDPDFRNQVAEISAENASDLNIDLLDLDQLLAEQEAKSLKSRLKRLVFKIRNLHTSLRTSFMYFVKETLPILLKQGFAILKKYLGVLQEVLRQFGFKPLKYKLTVFAFIFLCAGAVALIYRMATHGLVHQKDQLFMQSMEELSEAKYEYDPKNEVEPFYDSVRAAQNILEIPKLVANIKRSNESGTNPMAACELYIEGNSPDVVVEMKDREVEIRDLFLRTIEDFTYDELASPEGKQKLLEKLVREANKIVIKGRIRKIYFKTIILKS